MGGLGSSDVLVSAAKEAPKPPAAIKPVINVKVKKRKAEPADKANGKAKKTGSSEAKPSVPANGSTSKPPPTTAAAPPPAPALGALAGLGDYGSSEED